MRIMLVINGLSVGGAEKVVADLADALVARGCDVLLVCLKGPMDMRPRRPEVAVSCLGLLGAGNLFQGYLRLRRLAVDFQPDVVHGHLFHATLLVRLLRLSLAIPRVVATMHTTHPGSRLRAMAYRLTDWLGDLSTNVSTRAVEEFIAHGAVPAGRMVAVHNGVPIDEFRPALASRDEVRSGICIAPQGRLLVAVGRLNWAKDYPTLLHAFAGLPARADATLLVAGDGPDRGPLERLARQLGIGASVRFLGTRDDVVDLMRAADVFVLSSVLESFGLVVAEAMACECVVVATDAGGVAEVVGDAGFLVPSANPAALGAALLAALDLPHTRARELGRAARRRIVDRYSSERAADSWHALYSSLLATTSVPCEQEP